VATSCCARSTATSRTENSLGLRLSRHESRLSLLILQVLRLRRVMTMTSTTNLRIQDDKRPRVDTGGDAELDVEEGLRREKRSKQQSGHFSSTSPVATAAAFPQDILVANPANPEPQNCPSEISLSINLPVQPLAHAQNLQASHLSMLATKWMNSSQLNKMVHEEGEETTVNLLLTWAH